MLSEDHGRTRLISRNRFRLPTLAARLGMLPMEPASLVTERKMLRGIKERPSASHRPGQLDPRGTGDVSAGLDPQVARIPVPGRAPRWDAGVVVATRHG